MKLFIFFLLMVLTIPLFPQPNPPTNFRAIGIEGKVKLTWTNPSGYYDGIYVYRNGVKIAEVNNGNTYYEVIETTTHSPQEYYLKTWVDNWEGVPPENVPVKQSKEEVIVPDGRIITLSSPTTTLIEYSIECWYLSTFDYGDGSTYLTRELYTNFNLWSSVKGGDTIYYDGGSSGLTYTTTISPTSTPGANGNETSITRQAVLMSAHVAGWCTGRAILSATTGDCISITASPGICWLAIKGFEIIPNTWTSTGISLSGTSNFIIDGNIFTFNKGKRCIKLQADGITRQVENFIVRNNIVNGAAGTCSTAHTTAQCTWNTNGDFILVGRQDDDDYLTMLNNVVIENNTITLANNCSISHTDIIQFSRLRRGDNMIVRSNFFHWQGEQLNGKQIIYVTSTLKPNPSDYSYAGGMIEAYNNVFLLDKGKAALHINNWGE